MPFLYGQLCQIRRDIKSSSYLDSDWDITYTGYIRDTHLFILLSRVLELLYYLLLREPLKGRTRRVDFRLAHLVDSHLMGLSEMEANLCLLTRFTPEWLFRTERSGSFHVR